MENLAGITDPVTGSVCSQYQGSSMPWCTRPLASRVPPRENTASTVNVTAVTRTGSNRQKRSVTSPSTASIGQPR